MMKKIHDMFINKKIYGFLFLSLIAFNGLLAQLAEKPANIAWSNPYSEPPKSVLTKIVHTDANGFYGLRLQSAGVAAGKACLLYTSPSPRDKRQSRMPSSA